MYHRGTRPVGQVAGALRLVACAQMQQSPQVSAPQTRIPSKFGSPASTRPASYSDIKRNPCPKRGRGPHARNDAPAEQTGRAYLRLKQREPQLIRDPCLNRSAQLLLSLLKCRFQQGDPVSQRSNTCGGFSPLRTITSQSSFKVDQYCRYRRRAPAGSCR